jgi:hypothetical protein
MTFAKCVSNTIPFLTLTASPSSRFDEFAGSIRVGIRNDGLLKPLKASRERPTEFNLDERHVVHALMFDNKFCIHTK